MREPQRKLPELFSGENEESLSLLNNSLINKRTFILWASIAQSPPQRRGCSWDPSCFPVCKIRGVMGPKGADHRSHAGRLALP